MTRWKAIADYEGIYEVSDTGRVRSLNRSVQMTVRGKTRIQFYSGKELSPAVSPGGYLYVNLTRDGVGKVHKMHRLVATAFVKKTDPSYDTVMHRNDTPGDNHYTNLRWGTQLINIADMVKKRRQRGTVGESNVHARLTETDVLRIRRLLKQGHCTRRDVVVLYEVSKSLVDQIVSRRIWTHI